MYKLVTVEDIVRIPPNRFGEVLDDAIISELDDTIVGTVDKEIGIILAVTAVAEVGDGMIVRGDGAIFYRAKFKVLVYEPMLHEVIEGEVTDITEFGAFVNFGPMDGLIHVSQITEDYMDYDSKGSVLTGKETKKVLKKDDKVRARIVAISLKGKVTTSKIGLTMRQPYLGKIEWLEEQKKAKNKKEGKDDTSKDGKDDKSKDDKKKKKK